MYTLYKFHFLNGISEINQLFDDILIIWCVCVYVYILGVDRYVFFRADADTDYYRSSRPRTDIRVWCKNENECQN